MKKYLILLVLIMFGKVLVAQDQTINGNLHLTVGNEGTLRIGKIGDLGNRYVPIGQITTQYNIDFSGYRDIQKDQIGARISAIRFNRHQENNALVQNTSLAFFTNGSGLNGGSGDLVEHMRITPAGNIGIGTTTPKSKLEVNGAIRAKEIKIEATGWADFVFSSDYDLQPLSEIETHIIENGHLPNIPSETEVKENGIDLGEMQVKLLQKIEELTLYVIGQNKKNAELEARIKELENK